MASLIMPPRLDRGGGPHDAAQRLDAVVGFLAYLPNTRWKIVSTCLVW